MNTTDSETNVNINFVPHGQWIEFKAKPTEMQGGGSFNYDNEHVYDYDLEAGESDSELDYIDTLTTRLEDDETLDRNDAQIWLESFKSRLLNVSSDVSKLLTSYDGWLKNIQYRSGVDRERFFTFLERARRYERTGDIDGFLQYVCSYFTPAELVVADEALQGHLRLI